MVHGKKEGHFLNLLSMLDIRKKKQGKNNAWQIES